ncbi:AAEL008430-PA [Aedes aegypti]|uniref:AAEL008430-PA n=1 Tax=Aedes aegypti TaxID=7159 RepID=Q16YT2_AEDAE|nr:AAEL008430-PA [Aedes aegypti]
MFKIIVTCVSLAVMLYALEENCELEKCPVYGETETEHVLTLLPVPWNCSEYIMCDRGVQHIRPCSPGLHFIPSLHVCEFPDRATCVETCSTVPNAQNW